MTLAGSMGFLRRVLGQPRLGPQTAEAAEVAPRVAAAGRARAVARAEAGAERKFLAAEAAAAGATELGSISLLGKKE